ncbi:MAG TPA: putative porin, partial [Candidatus Acidoferrales bacterium]
MRSAPKLKRSFITVIFAVAMAPLSWGGPPGDAAHSSLELELEQLKASVQAEARAVAEHSRELDAERAALREEMERIAGLEAKLGIAPDASTSRGNQTSAALVSMPKEQLPAQTQTPQDPSNRIGNLEDRFKNFGPFSFSGDFRLRDETSFGGPANGSLDRNRERFRLRFNVDAKLNDDFSGGFSLASGDVNDPTTTNQTITDFYARKPVAIDEAFIRYTPHRFKALTLIGGKFGYPWYNTELTWDKDLNPEGLAQTLSFELHTPVLKKVAFVGFELPFAEVAGVSLNTENIVQSITYGGQIQTTWQLAPWLRFGAFSGFYNFHNADPIALALAKANSKNPQTPFVGALPLGT